MSPRLDDFLLLKDPRELLRAAGREFGSDMKVACSFSPEDIVIIDMIHELGLGTGVFAIDTGRLHDETFEVAEAVRRRFGLEIEWHFPDRAAVEGLERAKGLFSFRESLEGRLECCAIRRVEPLARALQDLRAWVTGRRQEQGVTRLLLSAAEKDPDRPDVMKINPLAEWTSRQVWDVLRAKDLPCNSLHAKGFPSIGCAPCTRAVTPSEDERSGRWWWEKPETRECGLHVGRDDAEEDTSSIKNK